jgi:hypothetical protein
VVAAAVISICSRTRGYRVIPGGNKLPELPAAVEEDHGAAGSLDESSQAILLKNRLQFLLRVHYDGAVPGDGFADGHSGNQ